MYENEQLRDPRLGRDPRSIPLYVPPEPSLPLWPAVWGWRSGILTFLGGLLFFGGLGQAVICIAALLG